MTIGEKIKKRRKELGISINELAYALGKDRATIYRYENNEISSVPISLLEPLAKILQTTTSFLCSNSHYECNFEQEKKPLPYCEEDLVLIFQNEDIRKLLVASKKMTPEQTAHILKYAVFMYPEAFL